MANQAIETVNQRGGYVIISLAALVFAAGIVGYHFFSAQPTVVRLLMLLGGLVAGLAIAWLSAPGKEFINFARESYLEARRVVWPSRKETVQTTLIVFAFVFIMALFLFATDKTLEWILYDLLLGWRK
ncbi:MAG: preprotein translocase subunit SecE [Burkholderiaceae bacterium]|nr:preprotein translocase subunit SecE [Burkholderiaceae bacterium]